VSSRASRSSRAASALGIVAFAASLAAAPAGAHALHAHDRARLHEVSYSGATVDESGHAIGTLPGEMRVRLRVSAILSGSFEISAKDGTIEGHGSARPHGSGVYESFAGTLIVTGGSGRYRHAHGRAALYGVFDRNSYALTIKTSGTLHY
jgi:hypothetical protein